MKNNLIHYKFARKTSILVSSNLLILHKVTAGNGMLVIGANSVKIVVLVGLLK